MSLGVKRQFVRWYRASAHTRGTQVALQLRAQRRAEERDAAVAEGVRALREQDEEENGGGGAEGRRITQW
eukprot:3024951-Rhodomonas_salina.1